MKLVTLAMSVFLFSFSGTSYSQASQTNDATDTEKIAQRYLDEFKKSGVPTPDTVSAALSKASESKTIQNWEFVARAANSYANVIAVMKEHYSDLWRASRSGSSSGIRQYLDQAVAYETEQNRYLGIRNDAYLNQAELHLAAGNKVTALSLAMTSMRLSSGAGYPNSKAERLIKSIIEHK